MSFISTGTFARFQNALDALDALAEAGVSEDRISLLMSDRTAERHFAPPGAPVDPAVVAPRSERIGRLAAGLRPAAALGTPGTGLVAVGHLVAVLSAAGLGTSSGLDGALRALGASSRQSQAIAGRIKNGAVLIAVDSEEEGPVEIPAVDAADVALGLRVERPVPESGFLVRPKASAAGAQRAQYEPAVQPVATDDVPAIPARVAGLRGRS